MRHGSLTIAVLTLMILFGTRARAQDAHVSAPVSEERVPGGDEPRDAKHAAETVLRLPASLVRDFRRLVSKNTVMTMSVASALALGTLRFDGAITRRANASAALDETFEWGDTLGNGWTQATGAIGTLAIGHLTGSPRMQALGADLMRAQALNAVLTRGLKVAFDRTRPDGARFSFPSGHASAAFATATALQYHFGGAAGLSAYAVAGYIAASRLQENRHYPSDVIVGAAVGIVSARSVTVGRGRRASRCRRCRCQGASA